MVTKRITITTGNVSVDGKDYGPDYDDDTVEAPLALAESLISRGRAVEATEKKTSRKSAKSED